jgi:sporulation protein YlmC with PRC-barrel domain
LRCCHGFLVDTESGAEVGVVDDVELASEAGEMVALVVARGWFGREVARIDVSDVQAIVASERRLIVRDDAVPAGRAGDGQV